MIQNWKPAICSIQTTNADFFGGNLDVLIIVERVWPVPPVPKIGVTIAGFDFEAPQPYCDGYTISLGEALILNAQLQENLRNNFMKRIKARRDKVLAAEGHDLNATDLAFLRTEFATYAAQYRFPTVRTSRQASDPVDAAAHKIAEDIVRTKLNEKGRRFEEVPEEELERHIDRIRSMPRIREEAERRVEASLRVLSDTLKEGS